MTNRLINSQSLYLRKHAHNPIDWWSWGVEALLLAKSQDKPIFLSIGYSSCHWCTVMEGEAFSHEEIAEFLNENFVPIKVDREERPDIDSIYMLALQLMTGQGGWPLNIFLTPGDLVPFYGGTYFPLEPRYNRPGFLQVLQSIARFYHQEKGKLQSIKSEILSALQESNRGVAEEVRVSGLLNTTSEAKVLNKELLFEGIETNSGVIGRNNFGNPSFPMIPYADLTLKGSVFNFEKKYHGRDLASQRGKDLALGGIYDHVAGGFHRYTVDANWTVPHFEKMLYDNGQIVEYLANLWSAGIQEPEFERAISLTFAWLQREMTSPSGYFYAAIDADNFTGSEALEPEEGAFYVWDYKELQKILTALELEELESEFTVTASGNFEGTNVLQRSSGGNISDSLEEILDKLFEVRYGTKKAELKIFPPAKNNVEAKSCPWLGRIPPVTDTKMIVAWNSLMISGLARASAVFREADYGAVAAKAANFILENQWVNGRFHRLNYDGQVAIIAQSEDYAFFIKALLDLYARDLQPLWLEKAREIQEEFDRFFFCVELGGYYNKAKDEVEDLLILERSYLDNATPSANGVAIANLLRLSLLTEDLEYRHKAEESLKAFAGALRSAPQSCPSLFAALDWYLYGSVVSAPSQTLEAIIPRYFPDCVYRLDLDLPAKTIGLVCRGVSCLAPALTLEQLLDQLETR